MQVNSATSATLGISADDMLRALRQLADAWPQVIWMTVAATGQQLYVNPAWCEVTGQTPAEAYTDPLSWQRTVHEDDIERVGKEYGAWAATGFSEPLQLQMRYRYADGSVRWVLCIACATGAGPDDTQVIVGIAIDNTDTEEFIQEALKAAHSDSLTGLRNRRGFLPDLAEALRDRRGTSTALLLVDLDGFKAVNDLYGHAEGDRLLQRVSDAIRSTIRASDLAFRLGGDEFAVIQRDTSRQDSVTTAERIVEAIRRIEPRDPAVAYDVAASCGIALSTPEHPLAADTASAQADAALYAAKTFARGGSYVFPGDSPSEAEHMLKQPTWGKRLHEAFQHDEFQLLAQPVVSLDDGTVTGFELLLRLDDMTIGADELILNIYRLGRKRQLDRWVVERAAQIATEHATALNGGTLGINVSIVSLADPSFTEHVRQTFAHVPDGDRRFVFEITERDA
ncbi:MAG: diguanylate cyclase domain-containing protein, partial [Gaiellales bacterium]